MVQLKLVLDTRRQKADGSFPISYRVTQVKKVIYISSGISIQEIYWEIETRSIKKNHPNAVSINTALSKKFYEIQKAILDLTDMAIFSFEHLRDKLDKKPVVTPIVKSFNDYSKEVISSLHAVKRVGNATVYQTAVNQLMKFWGKPNLDFTDIDYNLLDAYRNHLISRGIKINSISNYFRTIRAIYNRAIKAKLVSRDKYPFYDVSIKTEKTVKRAISKDHIKIIEGLNLIPHTQEWHARNYFLLSFYLIGMSFTDMAYLKNTDIINGRVSYRRKKTHKLYNIKLFTQAEDIIRLYYKHGSIYILPILPFDILEETKNCKAIISQWIKTTNKYLNRLISDPLTTYVSRHTWATTAKKLGYSNEMIAEALGHEYGNKVSNIYLDSFDTPLIDEMHKDIIK
jgi:integrase/recombinase XerD